MKILGMARLGLLLLLWRSGESASLNLALPASSHVCTVLLGMPQSQARDGRRDCSVSPTSGHWTTQVGLLDSQNVDWHWAFTSNGARDLTHIVPCPSQERGFANTTSYARSKSGEAPNLIVSADQALPADENLHSLSMALIKPCEAIMPFSISGNLHPLSLVLIKPCEAVACVSLTALRYVCRFEETTRRESDFAGAASKRRSADRTTAASQPTDNLTTPLELLRQKDKIR